MAKWEIRFQRFAISFRLPPLPRRSPAWRDEDGSLQPLARDLSELAFATGANEKFHLFPASKSKSAKGQTLPGENITILGLTLLQLAVRVVGMKTDILKEKPEPPSNNMVCAFKLGTSANRN